MVKKKEEGLEIKHLFAAVALLLLFILIIVVANHPFKQFDENRHVCDEWNCKRCAGHYAYEDDCADWRDKTKCELNPNHKDCKCDEWEMNCEHYLEKIEHCSSGNCREHLELLLFMCRESNTCIKAHKANECEQGHPDYVWKEHIYCDNMKCSKMLPLGWNESNTTFEMFCDCPKWVFHDGREFVTVEIKKTCRLKTLQDLTCAELEQAWQEGNLCNYPKIASCYAFIKSNHQDKIEHQQLLMGCFSND